METPFEKSAARDNQNVEYNNLCIFKITSCRFIPKGGEIANLVIAYVNTKKNIRTPNWHYQRAQKPHKN